MVMYKYVYFVDSYIKSNSLSALRASIEDYCRAHDGSFYDGEYVFRLIYYHGRWQLDCSFCLRIQLVDGKVHWRRDIK